MSKQTTSLALLDQAGQLLANAKSFEEIKSVRDKAEAVRKFAKSAAMSLQLQNSAAELKLRAERKAGEYLAELSMRGGDRKSNDHDDRLKLADLGINQSQSTRWQLEAAVPENVFKQYMTEANESGSEITAQSLLRVARKLGRPKSLDKRATNGRANRSDTAHQPVPELITRNSDEELMTELLTELRNHHEVLLRMLQPICGEPHIIPKVVEKRTIMRLLTEMKEILTQVRACQPRSKTGHNRSETIINGQPSSNGNRSPKRS